MAFRSVIHQDTRKTVNFKQTRLQQQEELITESSGTFNLSNNSKECQTALKPKADQLRGLIGGELKLRQFPSRRENSDVLQPLRTTSMKTQEAENYKKQHNLKLSDYLRLTSMSKKSSSNSKNKSLQSQRMGRNKSKDKGDETLRYNGLYKDESKNNSLETDKKCLAIDNEQGIQMVKNQTMQEMKSVEKELLNLLEEIDNSELICDDEESLVFMCNVLNIFEEKIGISVGIAQDLVEEQKKAKQIAGFKEFKNEMAGGKMRNRIRKSNTIINNDFYKSSRAFN